jgi:hypothetical protein
MLPLTLWMVSLRTLLLTPKLRLGQRKINKVNMGVGFYSKGNYPPVNPYGVGEMRGYGAAIKGRKISGKMG